MQDECCHFQEEELVLVLPKNDRSINDVEITLFSPKFWHRSVVCVYIFYMFTSKTETCLFLPDLLEKDDSFKAYNVPWIVVLTMIL